MAGATIDSLLGRVLGDDEVEGSIAAAQLSSLGPQALAPVVERLAAGRSDAQHRLRAVARVLAKSHPARLAEILTTTASAYRAERITTIVKDVASIAHELYPLATLRPASESMGSSSTRRG